MSGEVVDGQLAHGAGPDGSPLTVVAATPATSCPCSISKPTVRRSQADWPERSRRSDLGVRAAACLRATTRYQPWFRPAGRGRLPSVRDAGTRCADAATNAATSVDRRMRPQMHSGEGQAAEPDPSRLLRTSRVLIAFVLPAMAPLPAARSHTPQRAQCTATGPCPVDAGSGAVDPRRAHTPTVGHPSNGSGQAASPAGTRAGAQRDGPEGPLHCAITDPRLNSSTGTSTPRGEHKSASSAS